MGPIKLKKKGEVAYRLQFFSETRIHPIFHVFLLKKYYLGDLQDATNSSKYIRIEIIELKKILQTRMIIRQGQEER